ncbi:hypothetical protein [uncultured Dubosiella sp.]|uniref:hypothetical protein n=1 Tax=uncultured Dubosiella sp. TaxID=1937011 RepID=UPI002611BD0E|nr:hypothetical protein [uncultured Dubosiella sp.]
MKEEKNLVKYSGCEDCNYIPCEVDGVELFIEPIEKAEERYNALYEAYKKNPLAFWYD